MKKMVKMTIWMPVQMKANLDKFSKKTGLNLSDTIRRAIDSYIIDSYIAAPVSSRVKTKGEKENGCQSKNLQESQKQIVYQK